MKKFAFLCLSAALGLLAIMAFSFKKQADSPANATKGVEVKWLNWNEAVKLQQAKPKKMLIDVYTDWCGWCKKMDKSTFVDSTVAAYLEANFYTVKFNAEQKPDIVFGRDTFKYVDTGNGRGVHTLAYALLDGKMGYPSIVYLNEKFERILISPGFKDAPMMLSELKFTATELYKTKTWEQYRTEN